jgi:hypothetical protein
VVRCVCGVWMGGDVLLRSSCEIRMQHGAVQFSAA